MIEVEQLKQYAELGDLVLDSGQTLQKAQLCYQVVGSPNAQKDNIVLVPSYYGGSHWGSLPLLGAGSPLAGGDYCVVLTNLFGAGWSSSPSNAAAGQQGADFPRITLTDNVRAQRMLLDQLFGPSWQLRLVTGWSMGGMQALHWALVFPEKVRSILPFCCTARCWPHNFVFLEGVKAALQADSAWLGGRYTQAPERGLRAFGRAYAGWAYSQAFFRKEQWRELGFPSVDACSTTGSKTIWNRMPTICCACWLPGSRLIRRCWPARAAWRTRWPASRRGRSSCRAALIFTSPWRTRATKPR